MFVSFFLLSSGHGCQECYHSLNSFGSKCWNVAIKPSLLVALVFIASFVFIARGGYEGNLSEILLPLRSDLKFSGFNLLSDNFIHAYNIS